MEVVGIPGCAIGVLDGGEETVGGLGVTSVEHPLEVDGDTLFQTGSITKTFTGTLVMRLLPAGPPAPASPGRAAPPGRPPPGRESRSGGREGPPPTHTRRG